MNRVPFYALIVSVIALPPVSNAAVGRTVGEASVSPTGDATYTIPIRLPAGINDLTPNLAISYSHSMPEGLAGVGWGISGLSAISRCPKTDAQDGDPDAVKLVREDRLCMDGNQLRLTSGSYGYSGSTYRTEVDLIARITANGSAGDGPAWFKVESKDGLIYEFGNTADSRIESLALGDESTARVWALSKISDRAGNEIQFEYVEDGPPYGTYRPSSIVYAVNPSAGQTIAGYKVTFVYESQPALDVDTSYATGGLVEDIKRLTGIHVDQNLALMNRVRSYILTYEANLSSADRSRLASVKECGKTVANCLSPTTFVYQNGTNSLAGETSSGSSIPTGTKPLALDINGDGRTDFAYPSAASGGTWMYRLANTSGGYSAATSSGISSTNHADAIVMDHNTDGLDDILVPYSGSTWWAIHGTSSGLASSPVNTSAAHQNTPGNATSFDRNGDGRDDLIWGTNVTQPIPNAKMWVATRNATGNGFSAPVLVGGSIFLPSVWPTIFDTVRHDASRNFDVNGDGFKDVAYVALQVGRRGLPDRHYLRFLLGNNQGTRTINNVRPNFALPIDLNGDGYTDVLYEVNNALYTSISKGTNFGSQIFVGTYSNLNWTESVVVDWSGDGMEDLLIPDSNGYWYVAESDGFTLQAPVSTGATSGNPKYAFATDSDGDALHDVAYVKSDNTYVHRAHAGSVPDLLTDVVDGYGNTAEFHYASLTDSSVYTKGSGAVLPTVDYLEPRIVVKTLEQSTGTGTTFDLDYQYEGATLNIEGRGLGGFAKRIMTDSRTGNEVTETYHTDFPYRGRIKKRELRLSDNTLVQDISHTWDKKSAGTGFEDYHFPYIASTTQKNFEVGGTYNGNQINTVTTTSMVDSYGTPYDVTVTTTEHTNANGAMPNTSFTQRTYTPMGQLYNVTSSWCIGRRQQLQRINSHSGTYGASITRTADYTWDTSNNCRVTKSVIEPLSSDYKVTTDLEYDTFGNVDKRTITGVNASTNMPTRVTDVYWGTDGRFPRTITNPLSQVTTVNWDSVTGDLLNVTDPNSLVRSWIHDDFNRETKITDPDGTYTDTTYTACGISDNYCGTGYSLVKTKVRASQKSTTGTEIRYDDVYLDAFDRTVESAGQIIGGGTTKRRIVYDASGRIWKQSSPTLLTSALYFTETTFDDVGRPKQVSRPIHDGTSSLQHEYIYYEGLKTRHKDAENNETWKISDALGRVHQSHDNLAHYQQFDFDAFGSLKRVQDCLVSTCDVLSTMTYVYGASPFRTEVDDMSMGEWKYSYNSIGEMTAFNDANTGGSLPTTATATFTWDKLGRPLTRVEAEGTTTWTWGSSAAAKNIGSLASVSSPGHSQSFTYDSYGRLKKHSRVGGGTYDIDYSFDSITGFLDSVQYPASTGGYRFKVLHEYDHGILKRVKRSDSGQVVYWEAQTQDAFGNVIDEDLGNGTSTIRGFDGVTGQIDYIQSDNGGTSLQDLSYGWDKVGNLLYRKDWRQSGLPTEDFVYDSLNRLTDADISGAATFSLGVSYEENGNIKKKDDVSANDFVYHSTNKHAVVTAGSSSYGYDSNGNMTSRKGDTITWTSYNYPSEIEDGSRTFEYSYDAGRQKWKQIVDDGSSIETTYFAGRLFEKNINSSDTDHRHYIMANGRAVAMYVERTSSSDYTRYFSHDSLGSTDGIYNESGTLDVAASFATFGERRDPTDWVGDPSASDLDKIDDRTDRGYTDHISLERSSLVHMNGRVYDAEIGRFLSPDPYVAHPLNTQGFNRYAYAYNNPMRYTDPSGFTVCGEVFSCSGLVVASALRFVFDFFGSSDDPPPPPDFCKDNTAGCGGVASAAGQYMPTTPSLPGRVRSRPCLFSCKGGVFGVVFDFGGPGTGNPIILWGSGEEKVEAIANGESIDNDEVADRLGFSTWALDADWSFGLQFAAGGGVKGVGSVNADLTVFNIHGNVFDWSKTGSAQHVGMSVDVWNVNQFAIGGSRGGDYAYDAIHAGTWDSYDESFSIEDDLILEFSLKVLFGLRIRINTSEIFRRDLQHRRDYGRSIHNRTEFDQ